MGEKLKGAVIGIVAAGTIAVGYDAYTHQQSVIGVLSNELKAASQKLGALESNGGNTRRPTNTAAHYWKGKYEEANGRSREEAALARRYENQIKIERSESAAQKAAAQESGSVQQSAPQSAKVQVPVTNNYNYYGYAQPNVVYVYQPWPGAYEVFSPYGTAYWVYGSPVYVNLWMVNEFWGLGYRFDWCGYQRFGWRPYGYDVFHEERIFGGWGEQRLDNGRSFYIPRGEYNTGANPQNGYFDPAARIRSIGSSRGRAGAAAPSQPYFSEPQARVRGGQPTNGPSEHGVRNFVPQTRQRISVPQYNVPLRREQSFQPRYGAPSIGRASPPMPQFNMPHGQTMPHVQYAPHPQESARRR